MNLNPINPYQIIKQLQTELAEKKAEIAEKEAVIDALKTQLEETKPSE